MRAIDKLKWKSLKAQENHIASTDKQSDWESEEAERIDSGAAIGVSCYTDSVKFLMKQGRRSLKRLRLFKLLSVECRMIHDDCLKALDTQALSHKQREKLESKMREAAMEQGINDDWVADEKRYFEYIDELLSDVIERFTALYTRQDPAKDVDFGDEFDDMETAQASPVITLTRH